MQLIIHPILRVQRDSRRTACCRSRPSARRAGRDTADESPEVRESWQYLRIDRIGERARRERRCDASCWRHWPTCAAPAATGSACARRALELCADISRQPPPLAADVISREPRAAAVHGGSPLHLSRVIATARLRRGRGGPMLRAAARAAPSDCCAVAAPRAGTGRHCRQHPPRAALAGAADHHQGQSSLDRASSRLSRLRRRQALRCARARRSARRAFSGLWTSSAYSADPRQVPWLRLKLKRVMEHFPFPARQSRRQAPGAHPRDAAAR